MKRILILVAVSVALIVVGSSTAFAWRLDSVCVHGVWKVSNPETETATTTIGPIAPHATAVVPDSVDSVTVTWPSDRTPRTYTRPHGCKPTPPTTVRSTPSTSPSTSTTTASSTTVSSPSTTSAPTSTSTTSPAFSTSTIPPTTTPSSTSSAPSTTAGPTSTTTPTLARSPAATGAAAEATCPEGFDHIDVATDAGMSSIECAPTTTSPPTTASSTDAPTTSAPRVDTLPVTGIGSGVLAAGTFALLAGIGAVIAARRRPWPG